MKNTNTIIRSAQVIPSSAPQVKDPFAHVQGEAPEYVPQSRRDDARDICEAHGVDLVVAANGYPAVSVQARYQRGNPQDAQVIKACLEALEAAGISTRGWLR